MAQIQVVNTLRAKAAEIERYIADSEKRLAQARADLAHVNASIRLFEVNGETTEFPVYIRLNGLFRRGELAKLVTDALQAAPDGTADTRQLTAHVISRQGLGCH